MQMYTYVPEEVSFSILGVAINGFAVDSFITVEPDKPTYTFKTAMDGSVQRSVKRNRVYKVSCSLQQSSPSNNVFSLIANLSENYGDHITIPILIKDKKGTFSIFSADSWIETDPNVEFGSNLGVTKWSFLLNKASVVYGGNVEDNVALLQHTVEALQMAVSLSNIAGFDPNLLLAQLTQQVANSLG